MKPDKQAGQALMFTAAALVALLGFVGLGVDMGMVRYEARLQRTAADAAAIAGATNLAPNTGVQASAQNASGQNGFTDNTGGGACGAPPTNLGVGQVTVTVCNPPITGPHAGAPNAANYVETYVSVGQPTYFMKIFGVNSQTVTARAVATNFYGATKGSTNYSCLTTLGPPTAAIEGVNINGSATLNAPTCGIADNGNFNTQGNALTVSAGTFGVSGSGKQTGNGGTVTCTSGQTNCPQYQTPAVPNPLASITPPCNPCTGGTAMSLNAGGIANPGTYTSISIQGNGTVTFNPGNYIINGTGGFGCTGTPTIVGTGVFFYFTGQATYNCAGNETTQFTAPSSGTYQGILFYQDPNDCNCGTANGKTYCDNPKILSCGAGPILGGNTGSNYGGVLYFPNSDVTFYGNSVGGTSQSFTAGVVIADAFNLSGNPTVNLQGQAGLPGGTLPPAFTQGSAILVE